MVQQNPEAEDIQLLRRACAGDSSAFHELLDRHAQRLYRLAVSLVDNSTDAEDVVQETFIGAYRGLRSFEERSSVKTWLTRILFTQAALMRRNRKRRSDLSIDDSALDEPTLAAPVNPDAGIDVQAGLRKLSPEHREILMLREFERLSYEEIAEVLNIPRGTVESRLHRARGELREKLKSYLP